MLLERARWRHAVDVVVRPAERLPHDEPNRQVPVEENAERRKSDELGLLVPLVVRSDALIVVLLEAGVGGVLLDAR